MQYINISFYQFLELTNLPELREAIYKLTTELELKGTVLISSEGINGFVAGTRESIDRFKSGLESIIQFRETPPYKESVSEYQPFKRMLVKIKKEIISMGVPDVRPWQKTGRRITAQELKEWYDSGKEFFILDTRNDYEVRIGTFKNALDMNLKTFRQFPLKSKELAQTLKSKPLVTFCTGGIRCEKASAFLENEGFKDVYQLDGGILRYFEEAGGAHYDGECFVFDQRVALAADLNETPTLLCFNCQNPVTAEEQKSPLYVAGKSCPQCADGKVFHKEKIAQEIYAQAAKKASGE